MNEIATTAANGTSAAPITVQHQAAPRRRSAGLACIKGAARRAPVAKLRRASTPRWISSATIVQITSRTPSTPADAGCTGGSAASASSAGLPRIGRRARQKANGTPTRTAQIEAAAAMPKLLVRPLGKKRFDNTLVYFASVKPWPEGSRILAANTF